MKFQIKKNHKQAAIGFLGGITFLMVLLTAQIASVPKDEFHEHANFAVFINGEQLDFAQDIFMNNKPCVANKPNFTIIPTTLAHGNETPLEEETAMLQDYLHLHDGNGSTIHVHKEGYTYADFFTSLGMVLETDHLTNHEGTHYDNSPKFSFRFFINNEEVSNLPELEIRDLDRALITYGPTNRTQESINNELVKVANNACLESGSCSHRGVVSVESCGTEYQDPWLLRLLGIKADK